MKDTKIITRLILYVTGLFIMTLGIAMSVKSNLGVSPISSIPYALTRICGLEMGKGTILTHSTLVLLQFLLLRRRFHPKDLLQVAAGILFGYFTTLCNFLFSFLPTPENLPLRLGMVIFSAALIAFGIFFYIPANIIPLAAEGTAKAISKISGLAFNRAKIAVDVSLVAIALIACRIALHSFGSVGIGTVIASVLVGTFLGMFNRRFGAKRDKLLGVNQE